MIEQALLDEEAVLYNLEGGIAAITLNRPDAANALQPDQRNRVIDLLADAGGDEAVRVVKMAAKGRHFCSGADVSGLGRSGPRRAGDTMRTIMEGAQRLIAAVLDCPKPVIGVVQGAAAGMGAHLAFACDMVVASEDATFIEVFVRRGITVDAAGAYLLPRRIGLQRAKELVFLGDRLSAVDARALGLVNQVVPPADLQTAGDALAARLAAGPTMAIAMAKRLLNLSLDHDRASAFLLEGMAQEITTTTTDASEGVQAFRDRRDPQFTGY